MPPCEKEVVDVEGRPHRRGLPVNEHATRGHPVHVCGLPFMELPLDRPGTCRRKWFDKDASPERDIGS